jgi:hypothetical protein
MKCLQNAFTCENSKYPHENFAKMFTKTKDFVDISAKMFGGPILWRKFQILAKRNFSPIAKSRLILAFRENIRSHFRFNFAVCWSES